MATTTTSSRWTGSGRSSGTGWTGHQPGTVIASAAPRLAGSSAFLGPTGRYGTVSAVSTAGHIVLSSRSADPRRQDRPSHGHRGPISAHMLPKDVVILCMVVCVSPGSLDEIPDT